MYRQPVQNLIIQATGKDPEEPYIIRDQLCLSVTYALKPSKGIPNNVCAKKIP